jgi:hypothetical protein
LVQTTRSWLRDKEVESGRVTPVRRASRSVEPSMSTQAASQVFRTSCARYTLSRSASRSATLAASRSRSPSGGLRCCRQWSSPTWAVTCATADATTRSRSSRFRLEYERGAVRRQRLASCACSALDGRVADGAVGPVSRLRHASCSGSVGRRRRARSRTGCMACKRTGPTGEPEVVLSWLDRHRCTAASTASRAVKPVIKGGPRRWE